MKDLIIKQYNGQTPSRYNKDFWNGTINWLSSGELNRGIVNETAEKITSAGMSSAHLKMIPKGTFLMAITGLEARGTRGNCAILNVDSTINQSCMAIFPKSTLLDVNFLFQWYRKVGEEYGIRYTQGTKQQSYNAELINILPITVPLIDEQLRINSILLSIDKLIIHQEKILKQYRRIKDVFLQQMFASDGDLLPKMRFADFHGNWEQHKIGDIAETYSGGTPSITDKIYYDGSIPFIRSAEIGSSKVELHISDSGLINSSARLVDSGDILYALYGATSGTVGISKISGAINQAILAIIPYENYDKEFICQWLNYNKEKIVGKYLQGGQGNLSGTIVKNLICTFPSYIEQNKIGIFLKKMDREIEKQVHIIENLKNQKDYYLQNLFC